MNDKIKIFAFVLSIVASVATIQVTHGGLRILCWAVLGASVVVLMVKKPLSFFNWSRRETGLSTRGFQEATTRYLIAGATPDDISWFAAIEDKAYGRDAVPEKILREWYQVNPTGFNTLKLKGGQRIGHINVLPIRPRTLKKFVNGEIKEEEILADSIYSPGERNDIRDLYVESIIIDPPKGYSKAVAIRILLSEVDSLVARVCDLDQVETVYALAASREGSGFMEHLGFRIQVPAHQRKDDLGLLSIAFGELRNNIAKFFQ